MTTEDGMVYLSEGKSVRFGSLLMYVAKVSVLTDMSTIKLPLQLIPDLYTPRGTINFLTFLSILYWMHTLLLGHLQSVWQLDQLHKDRVLRLACI